MMSTTGDRAVGQADLEALAPLMGLPTKTREDVIEQQVRAFQVIGSPGFPFDETAVRDRAGRAYDRAHDPVGAARQFVAAVASGDRTGRLGSVRVPALVLHGSDDKTRVRRQDVRRQRRPGHGGRHSWRRTGGVRRHGPQPAARALAQR